MLALSSTRAVIEERLRRQDATGAGEEATEVHEHSHRPGAPGARCRYSTREFSTSIFAASPFLCLVAAPKAADALRAAIGLVGHLGECDADIACRSTYLAPQRRMLGRGRFDIHALPLCQSDSKTPSALLEGWLAAFEYLANLIAYGRVLEAPAQIGEIR